MDRILVDECLSVALVATAKARGYDATHVVWLGKQGAQDWNLMPLIIEGGYAFVTNNRARFPEALRRFDIHAGLIVILPSVDRAEQVWLFNKALDFAERCETVVNELLEIDRDGSVELRDWPEGRDMLARSPNGS